MKARPIIFAALAGSVLAVPAPVIAQDNNDELRIRKLEAEVRALQRRVFPGSDGRFFEPEITGAPASTATNNATSTTAVTDILSRLGALETQIQRLTATTERNENAIGILTERLDSMESGSSSGSLPEGTVSPPSTAPATSLTPAPTTTQQTGAQAATTPAATGPSAERLEAVQAIAKPQSDDPADDEYSYGFRLWNAGFYPEAQQQLAMFIDRYPSHWRVTYGRNLLGRAYMDDNKPREAAPWFLNNYQADKTAARAGDSLLYLSEAMIALEDTQRACIALSEFAETYPALASGRLQGQYERNRARVTCN